MKIWKFPVGFHHTLYQVQNVLMKRFGHRSPLYVLSENLEDKYDELLQIAEDYECQCIALQRELDEITAKLEGEIYE